MISTIRIPSNGFSARSSRYSILASKTLRVRKYAAKSRLIDHAGAHQRLCLRFLCAKRPVWSGFPEFAAYFRFENSEVRGKTEFRQPDPGYSLSRPAFLTPKFGLCSAGCDFPRTSGNGRYGCGVHGKKSTEKRAIKRQSVVLGSVMGIAVAASLYRMRSARHNSPLGIFERRLYSLAAVVSESASQ